MSKSKVIAVVDASALTGDVATARMQAHVLAAINASSEANKINNGQLDDLPASKTTSGAFDLGRIPSGIQGKLSAACSYIYTHPSAPPCRASTSAQTGHATGAQITKLDGIATAATKYPDTGEQAFLDADHTKLNAIAANATKYPDTGEQAFLDADHNKLDGIATAATKYPDTGEQAFLDADHTKLNAIAANATKYPDTGEQAFLDADHNKLDGIEAAATVDQTKTDIDALNIDADTVDKKHAADLQFATDEEICLGSIPFSIYTPQSTQGTTHTNLKSVSNVSDFEFCIFSRPTAPAGWTLKGRFYGIVYSYVGAIARLELWNFTDSSQVAVLSTPTSNYMLLRSSVFTLPANTKTLVARMWHTNAIQDVIVTGAGIEFIAVKD